jgi:hypothetical protein
MRWSHTCYDLHQFNLGTAEIDDVCRRGGQRTRFQPEHLVNAMLLIQL